MKRLPESRCTCLFNPTDRLVVETMHSLSIDAVGWWFSTTNGHWVTVSGVDVCLEPRQAERMFLVSRLQVKISCKIMENKGK